MLAVDRNIVVRYLVGDGGEQFGRAVHILENNAVSIALTVVLETEWVLRDAYEYARDDVFAASGLDFADALHLAQSGDSAAFVTFDKRLVREAKGLIDLPVEQA